VALATRTRSKSASGEAFPGGWLKNLHPRSPEGGSGARWSGPGGWAVGLPRTSTGGPVWLLRAPTCGDPVKATPLASEPPSSSKLQFCVKEGWPRPPRAPPPRGLCMVCQAGSLPLVRAARDAAAAVGEAQRREDGGDLWWRASSSCAGEAPVAWSPAAPPRRKAMPARVVGAEARWCSRERHLAQQWFVCCTTLGQNRVLVQFVC